MPKNRRPSPFACGGEPTVKVCFAGMHRTITRRHQLRPDPGGLSVLFATVPSYVSRAMYIHYSVSGVPLEAYSNNELSIAVGTSLRTSFLHKKEHIFRSSQPYIHTRT